MELGREPGAHGFFCSKFLASPLGPKALSSPPTGAHAPLRWKSGVSAAGAPGEPQGVASEDTAPAPALTAVWMCSPSSHPSGAGAPQSPPPFLIWGWGGNFPTSNSVSCWEHPEPSRTRLRFSCQGEMTSALFTPSSIVKCCSHAFRETSSQKDDADSGVPLGPPMGPLQSPLSQGPWPVFVKTLYLKRMCPKPLPQIP